MPDFSKLVNALKSVSSMLDTAIRNDAFPAMIRPSELESAVRAYPSIGGKRLRPALVIWSAGLFGAGPDKVLPAACAVEIYHNWTLVHDDIIDCDDVRRGHPTSHVSLAAEAIKRYGAKPEDAVKFGHDFAILAGDVQQAWAFDFLMRLSGTGIAPEIVLSLCREMQTQLNRELISGEALDVAFALRDPDKVSEDDVLNMISGKTGAILRYCVKCGAAAAKGKYDPEDPDILALEQYASDLALAFQLQDDLLGIFGDLKSFGKPIGSDFQESKPTLLYIEARRRLSEDGKKKLSAFLGLPEYSEAQIAEIRDLLVSCGAADAVRAKMTELSRRATDSLKQLPANPFRDLLNDLVLYLVNRNV